MIKFTKMHGLGNDYLFINCIDNQNSISKEKVDKIAQYMSNRNFGVGSDGIILINKSDVADFKMNIFNSDGSEAQMCGNGIRCFAKYVYDNGLTDKTEIKIETLCGIKIAYLRSFWAIRNVKEITIDMGMPIYEKNKIPVILKENEKIEKGIAKINVEIENIPIEAYCVSMGNPHAIIFSSNIDNIDIAKFGKNIETDKHFPEKTNVEFVQILNKENIKMRVWERGSGETFACGTGACATAVVCNKLGLTRKQSKIHLKGGELKIVLDDRTNHVFMTGTATKVFEGSLEIPNIL